MTRLGAILVAFLSLISSLACCCPARFNPPPVVIQAPPVVVQPPVDVPPPKPEAPQPKKPPTVAGKGRTYDLIPIIDLQWDLVDGVGKWQLQGNQLKCVEGHFVPRVQVPYIPPEEYDFTVTFSQPGLRNGISLIMPKSGGGTFYWAVGFNNGDGYGFDSDRGANIAKLIQPNVQYVTSVQVRKGTVRTLVGGKVLIDNANPQTLNSDDWRRMKNDRLLGVACDDPCTFHRVQITEITGTGRPAR